MKRTIILIGEEEDVDNICDDLEETIDAYNT